MSHLNVNGADKPLDHIYVNTGSEIKEAWEARVRTILHGLSEPLCGISTYKDLLVLSTGDLTRYVKKLVLTGEEDILRPTARVFRLPVSDAAKTSGKTVVCTHFSGVDNAESPSTYLGSNETCVSLSESIVVSRIYIKSETISALDDFKAYLAAQYAAGTPVTIWYVLATPETEQITVPAHLTGTVEGYLTHTEPPTPTNPIYPTANGAEEQGGTYSIDTGEYALAWGRADPFTGTNSISLRGYGLPVKSWSISGNGQQTGTPTPDNPIMPDFVGERTGNLYPLDVTKLHVGRIENDGTIDYEIGTITVGTNSVTYRANTTWRGFYTDYIWANENENLTFSPNNSPDTAYSCNCYDENDNFLGKAPAQSTALFRTFTTLAGTKRVRISVTSSFTEYTITNPMLNLGSTALPYEPYGYKIPITPAGQTQNVYLGQTVRRVRKLVLTGQETSWHNSNGVMFNDAIQPDYLRSTARTIICSHYQAIGGDDTGSEVSNGQCALYRFASVQRLYIRDDNYTSVSAFKAYLAAQYAAGTPVTVWYVLAEPETTTVNEPLAKIGDYADELSSENTNTTLNTNDGATTITVDTTLSPSEFVINVHAKAITP